MLHWNVRKRDLGFTLIEILVTSIIVGIIAAIASPNFIGMYNRYRVEEGMRQIEGAIKEAQRQAIRNGKTCEITIGDLSITTDGTNTGCLLSNRTLESDLNTKFIKKSTSTTTNLTGATTQGITFSSKGNTDNNSQGTFIVSHDATNTQKCVQIEGLLGNIISGDYDGTNCN
jgi:prepilin-type N-terminal cleavage/methylation domain-containing protein